MASAGFASLNAQESVCELFRHLTARVTHQKGGFSVSLALFPVPAEQCSAFFDPRFMCPNKTDESPLKGNSPYLSTSSFFRGRHVILSCSVSSMKVQAALLGLVFGVLFGFLTPGVPGLRHVLGLDQVIRFVALNRHVWTLFA